MLALTLCALAALLGPASASAATGSISGTVKSSAAGHDPIEDVRVCAFREVEEEEFEAKAELGVNCELTAADGSYTITGLSAGNYRVEFWPGIEGVNYIYQYYNGTPVWSDAELVQVTTTAKTGIDAELEEGGEIAGKVTRAPGGTGVDEALVCAEDEEAPFYFECAFSESNGDYKIVGLPAGTYVVEFLANPATNLVPQIFEDKQSLKEATPVPVSVGTTTPNVNAALGQGGQISGSVTDATTHAGLGEVEVCAYEKVGGEFRCTYTEPFGNYVLHSLPPGTYEIEFFPEFLSGGYLVQWYNGASSLATATPVVIGAGTVRSGVDAALVKKTTPKPVVTPLSPVTPLPVAPPHKSTKKKLTCKKGFAKKKVKGKERCVKVHKHKRHHGGRRAMVRARFLSQVR